MVVRIRLARFGRKHAPVYNIVVAQARTARNSKPMEVLGTYDPIPKIPLDGVGRRYKDIQLDSVRAKYWLGVGAQPSDPVWRLLSMIGLMEPKYRIGVPGPASSNKSKTGAGPEEEERDPADVVAAKIAEQEQRAGSAKDEFRQLQKRALADAQAQELGPGESLERKLEDAGGALLREVIERSGGRGSIAAGDQVHASAS